MTRASATTPSTPAAPATDETNPNKKTEKKIKTVHIATPTRSVSTPTSMIEEILPTKVTGTRPLPVLVEKQADDLPSKQFQSIADSAILLASLHRSRMQWLCDGVFKKYWTKPVKRKKVVEEPPNNPDVKSMQKLGTATITIEPHSFDAFFYLVREPQLPVQPPYKPTIQQASKPSPQPITPVVSTLHHAGHTPTVSTVAPTTPILVSKPAQSPAPKAATPATTTNRPPTPPGGAKTTDPVIQMLASRAATDVHLKELMKVVATSKATPDQLREFQAHIDEFNAIVKRQDAAREAKAKLTASTHALSTTTTSNALHRSSPLNPQFSTYPAQPRPEPLIKHIIIEFTSPAVKGQSASSDRWLFPEYAVLDTQYASTEMTCSFLVERKGSDILAPFKDSSKEELGNATSKWDPTTEYYQPVTMVVKATQSKTIETIARSAKSLPDVQKYMSEVMDKKVRAPEEFLVHRLPREKADSSGDFVDSAVELSGEDDELKEFYPM